MPKIYDPLPLLQGLLISDPPPVKQEKKSDPLNVPDPPSAPHTHLIINDSFPGLFEACCAM